MRIFLLAHFVMCLTPLCAQFDSSSSIKERDIAKYTQSLQHQTNSLSDKLEKSTQKYLSKLKKQEEKLKSKLWKTDSLKAISMFSDIETRYAQLNRLTHETTDAQSKLIYIGKLDSLGVSLKLLQQIKDLKGTISSPEIEQTIKSLNTVQCKLDATEKIRSMLKERQQFLQQSFGNTSLVKNLKVFKKHTFYYQQQLEEYRSIIKDPQKMGQRLLKELSNHPAFAAYFTKYAQWASLFGAPMGGQEMQGNTTPIAGLQTRAALQSLLNDRFGAGPNVEQLIQSQNRNSSSSLENLLPTSGNWNNGSKEEQMPDFKPNTQKTKSFWKRLELGTNIQSNRGTRYFPVTTDWGLSAGYKLNDKSIAGIGVSYKMGWGKDIQHIIITSKGAGLRSFLDYKIKGSIWVSGGAEMNYRSGFTSLTALQNSQVWDRSALVGLSKKYRITKNIMGKIQLLYDFLWKEQATTTSQFIFRIEYSFRN